MYVRFPLSLRNVEDLLFERRIDICQETVRFWWNRFGHWRWHVDEVLVKINGDRHYLWRAVHHEGEILESFVTKKRERAAALAFLRKALKRHGRAEKIVTGGLRSYPATVRRQNIWHKSRRRLAECEPRLGGDFMRLGVWSRHLMVHHPRKSGRMRYGTDSTRERPHDRGGP
nr:DDE-type integrase/transposase/recombinase [Novosphingobium umbonatum]